MSSSDEDFSDFISRRTRHRRQIDTSNSLTRSSDDTTTTSEEERESDLDSFSSDSSYREIRWNSGKENGQSPSRSRFKRSRKRRRFDEEDSRRYKKFHYPQYYTHFHRRANYGKFSLAAFLRRVVMTSSNFTSKYYKEILMVLFCLASALASLRSGTLKTQPVGRPEPFFSTEENGSGLITDLFSGEYVDLARNRIPYLPSFLFYYAHWDSESIEAKKEFLNVAKYFRETAPGLIKFYAINCWWPDGQCRQNFKSLSHFPIFVAHACSSTGVIYNGPIRADPMIRFLDVIVKPFTRIDTEEELWRFRAQHDAIMLTSMNSTDSDFGPSFNMYREMALRKLEADPLSQIGFGIFIRRELGEKFFLATGKTISLVLFNEIHTAKWIPPEKGMKGPVGQVAEWVIERTTKSPITWSYPVRNGFANKIITPAPVDFSEEVGKRPLFVLVTRRYYPSAYSPFYSQLKEVALDYFNCNKSVNVTKLRKIIHQTNSEWMKMWNLIFKVCQDKYRDNKMDAACTGMSEQLQHWNERKRKFVRESLKNYERISEELNFTGLSCETERPFQFIAIDPMDVPYFTKLAIGRARVNPFPNAFSSNLTFRDPLDQNQVPDPVAFIIDGQNELVLPITSFNISDIARTLHNYTLEENSGTKEFAFPSSQNHHKNSKPNGKAEAPKQMSTGAIVTFTTTELTDFLETTDSPLLLMYSAQFCGFCTITLTHFVRVAQFLKDLNVPVVLGKIDTYEHSLPVNLAPETIPTFVFFPSGNRSESRILSTNEPITAQVILKFLLSHLDSATRIRISRQNMTPPTMEEGGAKNRANVLKRIEEILEALNSGGLTKFHEKEAQTNLEIDFTPDAVKAWQMEVLEHLRSIQIRLDTK